MQFNIVKFLQDHHIDHMTEGDRAKKGWVQVQCPFCSGSSRGYDLGIKLTGTYGHCWLCRGKSIINIIRALLHCTTNEAKQIMTQYKGKPINAANAKTITVPKKEIIMPPGTGPMLQQHDDYLIARNFDPILLEKTYRLLGTGRLGEYKNRIIVPISINNQVVSYQGRSIIQKEKVKGGFDDRWKACPLADEVVHHQHIVYGYDQCNSDACLMIEGVSDSWRMGPGSVGIFGLGYTVQQINLIIRRFKRVFIMLDPETQAQKIADEIAWKLGYAGLEVHIIESGFDVDPGDLPQDEADNIMRELYLKGWWRK